MGRDGWCKGALRCFYQFSVKLTNLFKTALPILRRRARCTRPGTLSAVQNKPLDHGASVLCEWTASTEHGRFHGLTHALKMSHGQRGGDQVFDAVVSGLFPDTQQTCTAQALESFVQSGR